MAHRSPILGYNHNVNYRGLVFHVQTEDSGVGNPHVFTHLFQGGVILSTRKLEYDVAASEDVVKMLMQAQHKSILKGLRRGEFDEKIDSYLGNDPKLRPRGEKPPAADKPDEAAEAARPEAARPEAARPEAARPTSSKNPPSEETAPRAVAPDAPVAAARSVQLGARESARTVTPSSNFRPRRHARPGTAGRTLIQRAPPPADDERSGSRSGKVLVSGPPIVVDSGVRRDPSKPGMRLPRAREEQRDSIFDQNLITEKSLDEVILAYLSEDAED